MIGSALGSPSRLPALLLLLLPTTTSAVQRARLPFAADRCVRRSFAVVLAQDAAVRGGKITDDGLDYSFAYQARYGGSSAWLTNLVSSSSSRVLTQISGHLSSTIVVAAVIAVAFQAASVGSLPEPLGAAVRALRSLPHEAVGSIIALLLAFRTGQAYDRFWEGRQLWDGAPPSALCAVVGQ